MFGHPARAPWLTLLLLCFFAPTRVFFRLPVAPYCDLPLTWLTICSGTVGSDIVSVMAASRYWPCFQNLASAYRYLVLRTWKEEAVGSFVAPMRRQSHLLEQCSSVPASYLPSVRRCMCSRPCPPKLCMPRVVFCALPIPDTSFSCTSGTLFSFLASSPHHGM